MVLINAIPDCMRGMIRGCLQALNLQHRVVRHHVCLQGLALPALIYLYGFNYCTNKLLGLWIAKTIVDSGLFLLYYLEMRFANWQEIADEAGKRAALASRDQQSASAWAGNAARSRSPPATMRKSK